MPKRHILAPHQPDVVRLAADQHPTPRAGMLIRHLHDSQPATARAGLLTRHHSEAGQVEQQRRSVFHRVASRVIDLRHRSAWEATPISSRYDTRSLTIYRGEPYYMGARYYAAWLGRWTSPDPSGFVDGPNLWRYCRNNPV